MDSNLIKREAIKMAAEVGLINLTKKALCDRLGIPEGSFKHFAFCTFNELVEEISDVCQGAHKPTGARCNPKLRRKYLFAVAVRLACAIGYSHISRQEIAEKAGVSVALVAHYFGTIKNLKRDILRHAIKNEVLEIVAQGIIAKDPYLKKAPTELKNRAIKAIRG